MNRSSFRVGELGITSRLLVWFLAIALVPCGAIAVLIEVISSRANMKSIRQGLMLVAEYKAETIDTFMRRAASERRPRRPHAVRRGAR